MHKLANILRSIETYRAQDQFLGAVIGLALGALLVSTGACSRCGDSFEVSPGIVVDGEVLAYEDCAVPAEDGLDLSGCCPVGYDAVGLTSSGDVVCVGVCS